MKTQSSERGERIVLVQFPFCFIPISRSVAEIQGFKVSAIFKDRAKIMNGDLLYFLFLETCITLFRESIVTCLQFGIGQ